MVNYSHYHQQQQCCSSSPQIALLKAPNMKGVILSRTLKMYKHSIYIQSTYPCSQWTIGMGGFGGRRAPAEELC